MRLSGLTGYDLRTRRTPRILPIAIQSHSLSIIIIITKHMYISVYMLHLHTYFVLLTFFHPSNYDK